MYICICRKITDRSIAKAVTHGANNRVALSNALGVGTCCGKCLDAVDALIEQHTLYQNKSAGELQATPALYIPNPMAS